MKNALVLLMVVVLAVVLFTLPSDAKLSGSAFYYKVVAAKVGGLVFYSDGQTPAADVPVRVWDINQRDFIFETTTDANGVYRLPKLQPGRYYITFDHVRMELQVVANGGTLVQQPHDIVVIIPRSTASMPLIQLNAILLASTITDGALYFQQDERSPVISP